MQLKARKKASIILFFLCLSYSKKWVPVKLYVKNEKVCGSKSIGTKNTETEFIKKLGVLPKKTQDSIATIKTGTNPTKN